MKPHKPIHIAAVMFGWVAIAAAAQADTTILSNDSTVWAMLAFRTPVQVSKDGQVTVAMDPETAKGKAPAPLPEFQSPLPAPDWMRPEFNDSPWDRQRSPVEVAVEWWGRHSSLHAATSNSVIYLRWKFLVTDPAKARDLRLALVYVGGVVVYLNGEELARAHLSPGATRPDTLADKYPDDLYCEPGGKFLQSTWPGKAVDKELLPRFERRYRRLDGLALPERLLRPGCNVLAVQVQRAAVNEAAIAAERKQEGAMYTRPGIWAYAGLKDIRLTSGSGDGVLPNAARPQGVQVWNVAPPETITAFHYGDPCDRLQPVTICAVKNGVFSGRFAVSSDRQIQGLKLTASGLKRANSTETLPASALRVRYAQPAEPEKSWAPAHRFDGLAEAIPSVIPVSKAAPPREAYLCQPIMRPSITAGAVASIWLTVRVPKEAKVGKYEGTVAVEAEGLKTTVVPLEVIVHNWTLPDPKDFRVHNLAFVSQEAVARHYGVPPWSEKHFELMGKSLALLAEVNSREIPMNLCIDFYGMSGNSESMVRWIKQPDGSFKHDFGVFDKYLDLVARHCGKPSPLRLNCWGEAKGYRDYREKKLPQHSCAIGVTMYDPVAGKLDRLDQPCPGTEESLAFWTPVIQESLRKIEARGWLDVACFGHNSYCYEPAREVISMAKKIRPEGAWAYTAHNGTLGGKFKGVDPDATMPVKYSVCVWTEGRLAARGARELLKQRPGIWCDTARTRHRDGSPLVVIRNLPEEMLLRGHDGVGDFGADLFPIKTPAGTGYFCLGNGRGTGGPDAAQRAILAPGADGPCATERFENFREGVELSEAILFLERALQVGAIRGDVAEKVNRSLDERSEAFRRYWYERGTHYINRWSPAGQAERDARLLMLCAEVAEHADVP